MHFHVRRHTTAAVIALAAIVGGCKGGSDSGGGTTTPPPAASIGVTLGAPTLSVTQGQSGTVTINLARTNFTGPVDLTLEGAPVGVGASFSPASVPNGTTSSTLTISPTSTAVVGTSTVTVRARGQGVTDQTATLSLTVSAAATVTLTPQTTSLSVLQGASVAIPLTINRTGGATGNVDLTAEGLPSGVTATFSPATLGSTATTSTLTLSATAAAPAGSANVTIRARGQGIADATTTVAVQVSPPIAGATTIAYTICGQQPIWVAYQSGTGQWIRANSQQGAFTINIAGRGGVAAVYQSGGGYVMDVQYATASELAAMGRGPCPASSVGTKQLSGSFAGLATSDTGIVAIAASNGRAGGTRPLFTLTGIPDGPQDIVAVRRVTSASGTETPTRFIVRRAVNLPTGSSIPVLDFGAAESVAPASANLTFQGLSGENVIALASFNTAGGTTLPEYFLNFAANPFPYFGVPSASLVSNDVHEVTFFAVSSTAQQVTGGRGGIMDVHDIVDRSVPLGPFPSSVTATVLASSPNLRARVQSTAQPEYSGGIVAAFFQSLNTVQLSVTPAYASAASGGGAVTTWSADVPDVSATAGFDPQWGLAPRTSTDWEVDSQGTNLVTVGPAASDQVLLIGFQLGNITGAGVAGRPTTRLTGEGPLRMPLGVIQRRGAGGRNRLGSLLRR